MNSYSEEKTCCYTLLCMTYETNTKDLMWELDEAINSHAEARINVYVITRQFVALC